MADLIDEIQELKLATIKGANESIEAGNLAAAQIQAQNATTNSIDILTNLEVIDKITALIGRAFSYLCLRNESGLKKY